MKYLFYLLVSLLLIASACNDSIVVGSDLLGPETVDVEIISDLEIPARTVLGDSIETFVKVDGDNFPRMTYLFGAIDDTNFGGTEVRTYFAPGLEEDFPSFEGSTLDSVVLVLPLAPTGRYGDPDEVHDIALTMLDERMDAEDRTEFYSNLELTSSGTPLHQVSTRVNYEDSLRINLYLSDSIVVVGPQLRMRLDNQFWLDLRSGLSDDVEESELLDTFPGFEIRSVNAQNSMVGVNLGYEIDASPANILFHYNQGDTLKRIFLLPLGKYRHTYIAKDYGSSALEADLDVIGTECLYLESQGGTNLALDFSNIIEVDDLILNHANLTLTIKPFDEEKYPAIQAIGAGFMNEDGELVRADNIERPAVLEETFPLGVQTWSYDLDLTSYIGGLRNGTIDNSELIVFPLLEAERANRALIYNNTSDPEQSIKLNLVLTKP